MSPITSNWENNTPTTQERLSALAQLSKNYTIGIVITSHLTGLSQTSHRNKLHSLLKKTIQQCKQIGVTFTILNFLDIDSYNFLSKKYPIPLENPSEIKQAQTELEQYYWNLSQDFSLLPRIPPQNLEGFLSKKDQITIFLAYQYYFSKQLGNERNAFRLASYQINALTEKKFEKLLNENRLEEISGVGNFINSIIRDFIYHQKNQFFKKTLQKTGFSL